MTLTGIDSNAISVCWAAYTTFSKKKRKNCPEFKKKSKQTNKCKWRCSCSCIQNVHRFLKLNACQGKSMISNPLSYLTKYRMNDLHVPQQPCFVVNSWRYLELSAHFRKNATAFLLSTAFVIWSGVKAVLTRLGEDFSGKNNYQATCIDHSRKYHKIR